MSKDNRGVKRVRTVAELKAIDQHFKAKKAASGTGHGRPNTDQGPPQRPELFDSDTDEDLLRADEHYLQSLRDQGALPPGFDSRQRQQESMDDQDSAGSSQGGEIPMAVGSAGGGGGSGGGAQGGPTADNRLPFGSKAHHKTLTYKKSFVSYVANGVEDMGWAQVGQAEVDRGIDWNEGWQIIPYGLIPMHLSAEDWFHLNTRYRKWRVKSFGAQIEGIIPFQEMLQGGTTREAVTSFSNKPNIHYYIDHLELLPDIGDGTNFTDVLHSHQGSLPYGPYTETKLKTANFRFYNFDPARWLRFGGVMPTAEYPQKIFSLYNTGNVKTLQTGQKLHLHSTVTNSQWRGQRPAMNKYGPWTADGQTELNKRLGPAYFAGFEAEGATMTNVRTVYPAADASFAGSCTNAGFANGGPPGSVNSMSKLNNYADTNLPLPTNGPPIALMKCETYYGTNNEPLPIFMQFHIHYTCTIEAIETDGFGSQFIPLEPSLIQSDDDPVLADESLKEALGFAANDNIVHRANGPYNHSYFYK